MNFKFLLDIHKFREYNTAGVVALGMIILFIYLIIFDYPGAPKKGMPLGVVGCTLTEVVYNGNTWYRGFMGGEWYEVETTSSCQGIVVKKVQWIEHHALDVSLSNPTILKY